MIFGIDLIEQSRSALRAPDGTDFSYGDLAGCVREMADIIQVKSLSFCMCRNVPGSVMGYLGLADGGAAPLLLDAGLARDQFKNLFDHYRPYYLWIPEDMRGDYQAFITEKIYERGGYGLYVTGCDKTDLNPDLAILLATSGSTGNPKLVRLSWTNLESNAGAIRDYLGIDEKERPITTLPMHYTYGLSIINSHLIAGACILMTTVSYVQQPFWDFFAKEKATSFGGVPFTYEILNRIHIFDKKLPSLTTCTQAGGKLSPELQMKVARWAKENGSRFFVMYGQTEATARMAYLPPEDCLKKPGSMGIPIPGGRFEIIDPDGNVIEEAGKSGELVYIGPNVSLGYANERGDLIRGDDNKGRLLTGDIARRDEDGYYYIVGRKKRFLKIFGIRVSLDECENILKKKFPGAVIFCSGQDNDLKIYSTDEAAARDGAAYLSDQLRQSRRAFSSYYISKIPRNEYGKILYKEFDKYAESR